MMKKRILSLLLCCLLLGSVGCSSKEAAQEASQTEDTATEDALDDEANVSDETGNSDETDATDAADQDDNSDEAAANDAETTSDENSNLDENADANTDSSADSDENTGTNSNTSKDSDEAASSTEDASDSTETTSSESEAEAAPTPSFTVERWSEEKTMYTSSSVNVRKGPSTDHEKCGFLNGGTEVTVKGAADTGWYLIMLGEEEVFVSNLYLQETAPIVPTEAPAEQPTAQQPTQETPSQPAADPTPAPTAAPAKVVASTIFVGDSRFVQMHEAVGETGVTWICENSKGYKWFCENAIPRIDNLVGENTKILINLGVNDPEHAYSYIETVNAKAAEWTQKGATVYYASVNPVWENPYTTNDEVITFNSRVSTGLVGVHWIDSYTYLTENGYRLVDGLHFSSDTSAVIYNYFITCIQ